MNHDSNSPAGAASSASLQTVAVRFQERALQLQREQGVLESTRQFLDALHKTQGRQRQEQAKYRQEFVAARLERDATESEALVLHGKSETLRREIQELKEQVDELKRGAKEEAENSVSKIENTHIIPHRARRELFLDCLRGRVASVEQTEKNREEKRKKLGELIELLRGERKRIEMEQNAVKHQTKEKQDAMVRETEEAQAISEKVRKALAERQQLREDLRRAKA